MNPEQLWDTTMNPAHRTLVQVTLEDAAQAERMVTILMATRSSPAASTSASSEFQQGRLL